jgi:hypothetical protein
MAKKVTKKRKSALVFWGVVAVGILIVLCVTMIIVGQVLYKDAMKSITNFDECTQASGSLIQETYPERCVTADGRIFVGPSDLLNQE